MDKVIVERPRWGSSAPSLKKGYRKYTESTPLEHLPKREPMLGRWRGREKFLNEHLGPMRRFLRSNVGRRWNKVHQELCEHISCRNAVQAHVLEHIDDYVSKHAYLDDGVVFSKASGWRCGRRLRVNEMYVCPNTGILKVVRQPKSCGTQASQLKLGAIKLFQRDEIWWELKLQRYPDEPKLQFDIWLDRPLSRLTPDECKFFYGEKAFAISKRQLIVREFKQLKRELEKKLEKSARRCKSR